MDDGLGRMAGPTDRHGQTSPSPSLGPPLLSASWSPPFPWGMPLGAVAGGLVVGGGGGVVVGGGAAGAGGLVVGGAAVGGGLVAGGGGAVVTGGLVVGGAAVGGGLVVGGAVVGGGGLVVGGGSALTALMTGVPARVIAYQVPPKPLMPSPLACPGPVSPAKV
jgi:hypothetical protein